MKLTATEQRVVELYSNGLKPREIANKLGISINTVYKALSKHRRLVESSPQAAEDPTPDEPSPELQHSYYAVVLPISAASVLYSFAPPQMPQASDISPLLKRLEDVLSRLERLLDGKQIVERPASAAGSGGGEEDAVPDFLRRNAWVKLLRGRS